VIYYTTNGSPPTTNSSVYSAPIQVSATTSINAIAVAPATRRAQSVGGTYSIAATSSVSLASAANVDGIATAAPPCRVQDLMAAAMRIPQRCLALH